MHGKGRCPTLNPRSLAAGSVEFPFRPLGPGPLVGDCRFENGRAVLQRRPEFPPVLRCVRPGLLGQSGAFRPRPVDLGAEAVGLALGRGPDLRCLGPRCLGPRVGGGRAALCVLRQPELTCCLGLSPDPRAAGLCPVPRHVLAVITS